MTDDDQRALTLNTIRTVARTLRQLAGWGVARRDMADEEFYALAVQVEQIEPGWCCPMCEEATCDAGCPLEFVREHLAACELDGDAAETRPRWQLTCYGNVVGEFHTPIEDAIPAADAHIRRCPKGPMPWATSIIWDETTLPELGGRWVSRGHGSWLNHHLVPTPSSAP